MTNDNNLISVQQESSVERVHIWTRILQTAEMLGFDCVQDEEESDAQWDGKDACQ